MANLGDQNHSEKFTDKVIVVKTEASKTFQLNCVFCYGPHKVDHCVHFEWATTEQCRRFIAHWALASVSESATAGFERQAAANAYLTNFAKQNPGVIKEARKNFYWNVHSSEPQLYCWSCSLYVHHESERCPKLVCRVCGRKGHSFVRCSLFPVQDFTFLDLGTVSAWIEEKRKARGFRNLYQRNLEFMAEFRLDNPHCLFRCPPSPVPAPSSS